MAFTNQNRQQPPENWPYSCKSRRYNSIQTTKRHNIDQNRVWFSSLSEFHWEMLSGKISIQNQKLEKRKKSRSKVKERPRFSLDLFPL